MARPTKHRIEGGTGRTTPKGGGSPKASSSSSGSTSTKSSNPKAGTDDEPFHSSRYTPPSANALYRPSPTWVPVLMFAFFIIGFLVIFLNYTEVLPSAPSGWYLMGGLGGILAGIITATQLR